MYDSYIKLTAQKGKNNEQNYQNIDYSVIV